MDVEVELWMHPIAVAEAKLLRQEPDSAEAKATARTLGVFDSVVAKLRKLANIKGTLGGMRPQYLASVIVPGYALSGWPTTDDGRTLQQTCQWAGLYLYQLRQVRSVVGILDCGEEIFVVWLRASLMTHPRIDGFVDDTDAALATQQLWTYLNLLIDLKWLELE